MLPGHLQQRSRAPLNKIQGAFFSFSSVPNPADEARYASWHRYDHMPEMLSIRGMAHGQRWEATSAGYRDARAAPDPTLAPTVYVTCYLMQGPMSEALEAWREHGTALQAKGRYLPLRASHLNGPFLLVKGYASPRVLVAPEAIPYRPNRGVFTLVFDQPGEPRRQAISQWLDRDCLPETMTIPGVAGAYWFTALSIPQMHAYTALNPPGRTIILWYLDGDPLESSKRLQPRLTVSGPSLPRDMKLLFAAPFRCLDVAGSSSHRV
jgi:hypothetical protein